MKRRWLVAGGLVAFVWTLVVHAPASLLAGILAKNSPTQLLGLQGNISEGRVDGIAAGGHVVLRGVHWRFHPLWLLALRASFDIETSEPATVSGRVDLQPWGIHLSGVTLKGSLKALLGAANIAYLPIDGATDAAIESVSLKNGIPESASGVINIRGLVWALAKPPSQLGDFQATFTTESDAIVANVASPSGPLESHGVARLGNDGSYSWDIQVKAKPGADQNTQNLLHSLGQPDAQGFYHTKNSGQLAPDTPAGPPPGAARPPVAAPPPRP